MRNGTATAILDEMLEPVGRSLGLQAARALIKLRVDEETQTRVEELAEKCKAGELTPKERNEYEAYVQASTLIGILQAKARRALAKARAA